MRPQLDFGGDAGLAVEGRPACCCYCEEYGITAGGKSAKKAELLLPGFCTRMLDCLAFCGSKLVLRVRDVGSTGDDWHIRTPAQCAVVCSAGCCGCGCRCCDCKCSCDCCKGCCACKCQSCKDCCKVCLPDCCVDCEVSPSLYGPEALRSTPTPASVVHSAAPELLRRNPSPCIVVRDDNRPAARTRRLHLMSAANALRPLDPAPQCSTHAMLTFIICKPGSTVALGTIVLANRLCCCSTALGAVCTIGIEFPEGEHTCSAASKHAILSAAMVLDRYTFAPVSSSCG